MTTSSGANAEARAVGLGGKRILIAEDDFFLAGELARDFRRWGAVVIGPVSSLAAASDALSHEPSLDGAVLDINLRGEMVYPLVDDLREQGVPCVFATGYDLYAVPSAHQHIPHCQKPCASSALVAALFG